MGGDLRRDLTIRQGVGSEILVRPQPDGTIEIGGRVELVETREDPSLALGRHPRPPPLRYDPPVRNEWDAIVVGLGAIGSGAAYWLSRRLGDRVLGLEQFELGHANGAGQDHSRIIRLSYHRPDYVRLARRAYETLGGGRGARAGRRS